MANKIYSVFRPQGDVIGAVAVVHGMAEHRRRYDPFAEYLSKNGYGIITSDLPGHGDNVDETPGYFGEDGWKELVDSAIRTVKKTRKEFPGVPVTLFGHSMGTMISRCFLQEHDNGIDALILSGAPNWQAATGAGIALGKAIRRVKGKKGSSKLMDQMITGNFNKTVEDPDTPVDWLSYNKDNVQAYNADELCGFGFTVQGYIDELTLMRKMHRTRLYRCTNPSLPIVLFAGEDDPCIGGEKGFESSVKTLRKAGYEQIETKLYPHMRHEILNETGKEAVYEDIRNWLDAHASRKNS